MWLSKAIEQDAQTKVALRKLERLIIEYQDATKLPDKSKFISTEIRWFRPSALWYVLLLVGFGAAGYCRGLTVEAFEGKEWLEVMLRIIVPIFVLAVTITNLARSFSESVKFAGEYFNEVCRMELYSCLTLLTILLTIMGRIIADSNVISTVIIDCITGCCLGATVSCITGIAFIIRETIRCAQSDKAIKVGSSFGTRKLEYALAVDAYNDFWMSEYSRLLKQWCDDDAKAICEPLHYYSSLGIAGERKNTCDVYLDFDVDIKRGYIDYELKSLKKLDEKLLQVGAKLWLAPHIYQKGKATIGRIDFPKHPGKAVVERFTKERGEKACRFRKDRFQQIGDHEWDVSIARLEKALCEAVSNYNLEEMKHYADMGGRPFQVYHEANKISALKRIWDHIPPRYYRLVRIYLSGLREILNMYGAKKEEEHCYKFITQISTNVHDLVVEALKYGDANILRVITWLVPDMYSEIMYAVVDKKSCLWELRARTGSFYDFAGSLLAEYESEINEDDRVQIQLVLHKGIISWLLIAIDNKDDELIKSLCGAAKKLVFPDKKITFSPLLLVTQHFILCGKMLEFIMEKKEGVTPSIFKLLCFDKYDHSVGRNIDYEELVKFYIESRKCDLRSIFHEFSNTDWERNPLSGGGFGTPRFTFSGNIELDYTFIYLALLSMDFQADVSTNPYDFLHYNLKDKIDKFKDIARDIGIHNYPNSKKIFEGWVEECSEMHRQQEAERIAESQIEQSVWQNYDCGFQEGLKETIPFVDYCVKKGYVEESDSASREKKWHMPKEMFLEKSADNIIREGKRHGNDIGSKANIWTVRSLIDFKDEENDEGEDIGMSLIMNDDARKKASKDVQRAIAWLKGTGCSKDQGMIVLRGIGPDPLHLFNEDGYQPAWREEGMERGFEGYYHGYPVLHLWGARNRPLCAAMDLRGWSGLIVRPELVNENQAGKVLRIRDRTPQEIEEAIGDDKSKLLRQKGYCVVELELFWKFPEEKPKQKVFLYELPPSELPRQENHSSGLQLRMGEVKQARTEKKKEEEAKKSDKS